AFTLHGSAEYFTGIYFRDSIPRGDHWGFGSLTGNLQLTYQDWAYLTSGGTVGSERGYHARFSGENFDPANGLPYAVAREGVNDFSEKVITFDAFRMVVGAGTRHLRLELGQDWNQWGPGHWQQTTLGPRPWFWVADSLPASPEPG